MERIGRYRIVKELGRGAMGVVYQAVDPTIGRTVAIKTIRLRELDDPNQRTRLRERLFREARSAGALSHPGIVTIYDMAEEDSVAYIAMQFVNGPTLDDVMDKGKPLSPQQTFRVLRQTAAALDFAHQRGIVHRDVKPANIMMDQDGSIKIADFGIAKVGSSASLTLSGAILGTPNYMSPEQVQGKPVEGRSDQFSLAVVAYEILTGERPFSGEHLGTVIFKIVSEEPVQPHRLNPSLSPEIDAVLCRGISKKADQRYPSCAEFVSALEAACAGVPGWQNLARGASTALTTVAGRVNPPTAAKPHAPLKSLPPLKSAGRRRAPSQPAEREQHSMMLPAFGAFAVVLGLLGFVAWESGMFVPEPPRTAPSPPAADRQQAKVEPPETKMESPSQPAVEQLPKSPAEQPPAAKPSPIASSETVAAPSPKSSHKSAPVARAPVAALRPVVRKRTPFPEHAATRRAAVAETAARPEVMPQDIWVTSNPPAASAMLDGNQETNCLTPCMMLAQPGVHTLTLSLAGHQQERREIKVENARLDPPTITMRSLGGMLMLSTNPPGAAISINDKPFAETTPATIALAPGQYRVLVEKDGHRKSHEIEISNGNTNYLRIPLYP